jgi:hypothetical protein
MGRQLAEFAWVNNATSADDAILRNLLRINNNFFKAQQISADMPRFSSVVSASTSCAN